MKEERDLADDGRPFRAIEAADDRPRHVAAANKKHRARRHRSNLLRCARAGEYEENDVP